MDLGVYFYRYICGSLCISVWLFSYICTFVCGCVCRYNVGMDEFECICVHYKIYSIWYVCGFTLVCVYLSIDMNGFVCTYL